MLSPADLRQVSRVNKSLNRLAQDPSLFRKEGASRFDYNKYRRHVVFSTVYQYFPLMVNNFCVMGRLDQGHLHPSLKLLKTVILGQDLNLSGTSGEHSSKELSRQLMQLLFGTSLLY